MVIRLCMMLFLELEANASCADDSALLPCLGVAEATNLVELDSPLTRA